MLSMGCWHSHNYGIFEFDFILVLYIRMTKYVARLVKSWTIEVAS